MNIKRVDDTFYAVKKLEFMNEVKVERTCFLVLYFVEFDVNAVF